MAKRISLLLLKPILMRQQAELLIRQRATEVAKLNQIKEKK